MTVPAKRPVRTTARDLRREHKARIAYLRQRFKERREAEAATASRTPAGKPR